MIQKMRRDYFNHWTKKYISLPYSKFDCASLIEFVLKDHFNIDYMFPQSRGSVFFQSHQIKKHLPEFCEKTENPKEGDLVLMNGLRRMCHVGLFTQINNKDFVLHSEKSMGCVSLHRINQLFNYGYSVEGFYTWRK